MRFSELTEIVKEAKSEEIDTEALEFVEELVHKGFDSKDIKSKLKKKFKELSKADIEILINLFQYYNIKEDKFVNSFQIT